jgi:hypothetical protein
MRKIDDKLLENGFYFPNGQGPTLLPDDTREEPITEQVLRPSELALDAPRVE